MSKKDAKIIAKNVCWSIQVLVRIVFLSIILFYYEYIKCVASIFKVISQPGNTQIKYYQGDVTHHDHKTYFAQVHV